MYKMLALLLGLTMWACEPGPVEHGNARKLEVRSVMIQVAQGADGATDGAAVCEHYGFEPFCDLCAEWGWYGDGTCDDFCEQSDSDCQSPDVCSLKCMDGKGDVGCDCAQGEGELLRVSDLVGQFQNGKILLSWTYPIAEQVSFNITWQAKSNGIAPVESVFLGTVPEMFAEINATIQPDCSEVYEFGVPEAQGLSS